jgi:hypothetical protein
VTTDDLPPATPEELDRYDALIESWLATQLEDNPTVASVERDIEGERRWIVRVNGEEKSVFSVWFHLRQRTLHIETYMMPAPEENLAQVYEQLLRRNLRFHGLSFGQIPVQWITEPELDRLLGSVYVYVEQCFRPAMRVGFASRFKG